MKKHIIICLNPFESHFLPTIALAKHLIQNQHNVTYMGFISMESIVTKNGFKFIPLTSCTNNQMQELLKIRNYKALEYSYAKLHEEVKENLTKYKADIVLMGISRYQFYLVPAMECGAKIFLYSLCSGIPWFNIKMPPITSDYLFKIKNIQGAINFYIWFRKLLRKGLNIKTIIEKSFYPWTTMRCLCRQKNIKWKFGIDGFFPDFPLIIFGTKYFETIKVNGLSYMGLGVKNDELFSINDSEKLEKPLIYCSLGTMNHRYKKAQMFYDAVIDLFRMNPQWKLVLSVGNSIKIEKENLPENITVYEFAPQLDILKKADLAITHGGHGTIKECIKYGVPMLVVPCIYDQRGNAAKVHFLKLGIKDTMLETTRFEKIFDIRTRKINPQYIRKLIEAVLLNPVYKKNILQLSREIELENELKKESERLF